MISGEPAARGSLGGIHSEMALDCVATDSDVLPAVGALLQPPATTSVVAAKMAEKHLNEEANCIGNPLENLRL